MSNSFFTQPPPQRRVGQLTSGYLADGKEMDEDGYNICLEQAAAGIWSNPTDLSRFIIELQRSLARKSKRLLSQELCRLMLPPCIDEESGLGFFIKNVESEKYFTHSGGTKGFISEYIGSFENGNEVVVMTNSGNPGIAREIFSRVAKAYNWGTIVRRWSKKKVTPLTKKMMNNYLGTYLYYGRETTISQENDNLWLNAPVKSKLYFTSDADFYLEEKRSELQIQL